MARFVAIPVTIGDAFFLERGDGSILVDGGINRNQFPELFRESTKRKGADIIVVTHNDADHTEGIAGFLKKGDRFIFSVTVTYEVPGIHRAPNVYAKGAVGNREPATPGSD